jgi:hypothetical protein
MDQGANVPVMDATPKGVEMRAVPVLLASLFGLGLVATSASAQCCYLMPPRAPDMCGPGFYCTNWCGAVFGPNYCVRPCFPPFQGMMFGPPNKGGPGAAAMGAYSPGGGPGGPMMYGGPPGSLGFPMHLYARSPRDYFMVDVDPANSPYTYGAASPLYGASGGGEGPGVLPPPSLP